MSDFAALPQQSDRLSGWKEIASHLGKGVRTVQRWEKVYGLPVHRLGGDGGEVVFAYRQEVDRWLRNSERARAGNGSPTADEGHQRDLDAPVHAKASRSGPAPAAASLEAPLVAAGPEPADLQQPAPSAPPPTWGRSFVLAAVALTLVGLSGLGWLFVLRSGSTATAATQRQPAFSTVEDDTLRVYNAAGEPLWSYRFEGPVVDDLYAKPSAGFWSNPVTIEDLDGDGLREVIVLPRSTIREVAATLHCFNHDGSRRWSRRLEDRARFGQEEFRPPWMTSRFRVLANADGTRSVWAVFIHGLLFPSVLEQIDQAGVVRSRYWSNGYIESLSPATWRRRPVLLVGAANNEHKGASLAILDREGATATAPAANPKYRCVTCPEAEPLGFVVFPPTPIGKIRGETTAPENAWVEDGDGVVAQLMEPQQGADQLQHGTVYYTLDADLRPVSLEISRTYQVLHDWWHAAGKLDRAFSPAEADRLMPLIKWEGGRFVEMDMARR